MQKQTKEDQQRYQDTKDFIFSLPVFKECKPLKVGIDKELLLLIKITRPDLNYSVRFLKRILTIHTHNVKYLTSFPKHTHRFDINNKEYSEITDDEREFTAKKLEMVNGKIKASRLAKQKNKNKGKKFDKSKSKTESKKPLQLKKSVDTPIIIKKRKIRSTSVK
ncbi:ProP expression regulator [Vibrio cholerae]|nr:ProP expression regulator [Vibrio cholerae]